MNVVIAILLKDKLATPGLAAAETGPDTGGASKPFLPSQAEATSEVCPVRHRIPLGALLVSHGARRERHPPGVFMVCSPVVRVMSPPSRVIAETLGLVRRAHCGLERAAAAAAPSLDPPTLAPARDTSGPSPPGLTRVHRGHLETLSGGGHPDRNKSDGSFRQFGLSPSKLPR